MTELSDVQLKDLSRLARDRCRNAFMSVAQLIESEEQRAAILTFCAVDFVRGSAELMEGHCGMSGAAASEFIIMQILTSLGVKFETRTEP